MSNYQTEEEQVEIIKRWWNEYGLATISGVIIAIIIVFGWQYYQRHKVAAQEQSSLLYETVLSSVMTGKTDEVKTRANTLIKEDPKTPYASLASLWLAKLALNENKLDEAVQHLQWVIAHQHHTALDGIAEIRLAKVYLAQNKTQEALQTLKPLQTTAYAGLASAVDGDAYFKLHQTAKARGAYQDALKKLPKDSPLYPLIQTKLANLPIL